MVAEISIASSFGTKPMTTSLAYAQPLDARDDLAGSQRSG